MSRNVARRGRGWASRRGTRPCISYDNLRFKVSEDTKKIIVSRRFMSKRIQVENGVVVCRCWSRTTEPRPSRTPFQWINRSRLSRSAIARLNWIELFHYFPLIFELPAIMPNGGLYIHHFRVSLNLVVYLMRNKNSFLTTAFQNHQIKIEQN